MRVGLAVSGGADSTALLVLMSQLQASHGFEAVVLHVDHGLREDSASDADYVRGLAKCFGLPFHELRTKVTRRKGESVEMAARRVRLGFFADAMVRYRLDCIATGHHMDDVAETFLMRLARASGAEGLAGLKPVSFVDGIVFIRPLLNVRGCDLRAFLEARGIPWREDSTNADTSILRNRVRHVVLPFLRKELDPRIVEHICRSAGYLREACEGLTGSRGASVADGLRGEGTGCSQPRNPPKPSRYVLEIGHSVGFDRTAQGIGEFPATASFEASSLHGRTLDVRTWRPGDWMRPCGFPHRRKLQDIFVTAKVPQGLRHELPIVADADTGEVLWLPGYRVSESVRVSGPEARSVRFRLSQLSGSVHWSAVGRC